MVNSIARRRARTVSGLSEPVEFEVMGFTQYPDSTGGEAYPMRHAGIGTDQTYIAIIEMFNDGGARQIASASFGSHSFSRAFRSPNESASSCIEVWTGVVPASESATTLNFTASITTSGRYKVALVRTPAALTLGQVGRAFGGTSALSTSVASDSGALLVGGFSSKKTAGQEYDVGFTGETRKGLVVGVDLLRTTAYFIEASSGSTKTLTASNYSDTVQSLALGAFTNAEGPFVEKAAGTGSCSFLSYQIEAGTSGPHTFSGVSLGAEAADRSIFVTVILTAANTRSVTSMTIGGVEATRVGKATIAGANPGAELWAAKVPTGTTGNIVVTANAALGLGIYRVTGVNVLAAYSADAYQGNTRATYTAGMNVPAGGFGLLACGIRADQSITLAGAGITQDGGSNASNFGAAVGSTTTAGSNAVTATSSSTGVKAIGAWAIKYDA
jgi:hypothetical protein